MLGKGKRAGRRILAAWLTTVITAAVMPIYGLTAGAASYRGSGTQSDPYLVETAAQLDGMRDNLSAHYKLANTIDLSDYGDFTPIGNLSDYFTGSFSCDLGSDGYPLYAIKNLRVTVENSNYVAENDNLWEAALFGAVKNSTITNIYVLNVKIVNNVPGGNSGSVAWGNYNPGQGEQAAAALIGFAVDSTIKGCMSSGVVEAKSNNAAGLIGSIVGGSVRNCYSTVNVTTSGLWNTGGLIGTCNAEVSNCFATGDVFGGPTEPTTGGLIGSVQDLEYLITNCYSTGTVASNGNSLLGYDTNSTPTYAMNCYTTGAIDGKSNPQTNTTVLNNNYILNTVNGYQPEFASVSRAELLEAFSGLPDWTTEGVEYPQLKSVKILEDEDRYVPGQVTEVPDDGGDTSSEPGDNSENDSSRVPAASLEDVTAKINALPEAKNVTADDIQAIMEAQKAYDSLSAADKKAVPTELAQKMLAVYSASMPVILKDVADRVRALPDELTTENKDEILAIQAEYEFLTEDTRSALAADLQEKLTKALEWLETAGYADTALDAGVMTTAELILIIVLSSLIVLTLGFNVFATVKQVTKLRKYNK